MRFGLICLVMAAVVVVSTAEQRNGVEVVGQARFTVVSPSLIRMEYAPDAAANGAATEAQALLTLKDQPAEMLFNVEKDPYQFNNLTTNPEYAAVLKQARGMLDKWREQTGDSVPENPTKDRWTLHKSSKGKVVRGDLPGAKHHADQINHPGPVKLRSGQ